MPVKCGNCHLHHDDVEAVKKCHGIGEDALGTDMDIPGYGGGFDDRPRMRTQTPIRLRVPEDDRPDQEIPIRRAVDMEDTRPPAPAPVEVTEGIWRVKLDGNWEIIKIQRAVHGTGNLYGKKLMYYSDEVDKGGKKRWVKIVGAVKILQQLGGEKVTLEIAREFGSLYGVCCRCGAVLTDETSIEAGIGPVCAKKFA